jgi:hypothetical protein
VSGFEWVAAEARTGRVIADLPDLSVSRVSMVLGSYTTTTAALPLPTAPEPWVRATTPKATTLVLLDDGVPVWGGLVLSRKRGSGDLVEMSLGTIEVWLDGVFVRDALTYAGTGQNALVADLCARYVIDGALPGLPLRVSGGTGGTVRDRTYTDAQDKSILSVLSELFGVEGGPEWTIGWEHQSSPERYTPVLYVGDRIGAAPIAGLSPAATFEMPGAVSSVELVEDWSAGKGATDVIASSSAVADVRPQSPHQTSDDADRPRVEHRFTPSTSISDVDTLTAHARRVLADMADGARTLTLSAVLDDAPRLGSVWALGDDVGFVVGGTEAVSTMVRVPDEVVPSGTTVRTNLITDPSCTSLTGFGVWWGTGGAGTTAVMADGGWSGDTYLRATWTVGASSGGGGWLTYAHDPLVTPGLAYSQLAYVRPSTTRSMALYMTFLNEAKTVALATYASVTANAPAGVWTPFAIADKVAPAGAVWKRLSAYHVDYPSPAGYTLDIDAICEVQGATAEPFFSGDTTDTPTLTYDWTGPAHASTSTETTQLWATIPAHVETQVAERDTVPAFPGGMSGTARAIGWELTLPAAGVVGEVAPILILPGEGT